MGKNSKRSSDPTPKNPDKGSRDLKGGLLAEMPETPLLALLPGTAATTGLIRGSVFVAPPPAKGHE